MNPEGFWRLAGSANHRMKTITLSSSNGAPESEIALVEFDFVTSQQFHVLLAKGTCAMMLFLLLDVTTNRFALRGAYRKTTVAFLPRKITDTNLIANPAAETDFNSRSTSAKQWVARRPTSKCT